MIRQPRLTDTQLLKRIQTTSAREIVRPDLTVETLAEALNAFERMKEIARRPDVPERIWLSFAVTHRELVESPWVLDVHRRILDATAEAQGFSAFTGREISEQWPSGRIVSYSRLYVARGDA